MIKILLTFALLMLSLRSAQAEILFSLSANNTNIAAGSNAVFSVFIKSDVAVTLGGYSVNVVAGNGNGGGGIFTSGTFDFLVGDPGQAWDLTHPLGKAYSTADTGNTGGTGLGNGLLANVSTRLGTLTLNTTGVAPGTYQMSLTDLSAIQVNGNFIPGGVNGASNGGPISYSITAVPEPSSIGLATVCCLIGLASKRIRKIRRDKSRGRLKSTCKLVSAL